MKYEFTIPGNPAGKGRPRFSTIAGHVQARSPEQTVLYENLVRTQYQEQCGAQFPDDAEIDVRIMAYYQVPKSVSKKKRLAMLHHSIRPTKKPDTDNIAKIICDSLNGIAYRDDAQVVDLMCRKFYSETPRVVVTIEGAAPKY